MGLPRNKRSISFGLFASFVLVQVYEIFVKPIISLNVETWAESRGINDELVEGGSNLMPFFQNALSQLLLFLHEATEVVSSDWFFGFVVGSVVFAFWDPVALWLRRKRNPERVARSVGIAAKRKVTTVDSGVALQSLPSNSWRAEIGGDVAFLEGVSIAANADNLFVASTDKREGQPASDGVRIDCFDLNGRIYQGFGRASGYSTFRLSGSRSVVNRMSLLPEKSGLVVGTAFDDPTNRSSAFMATVSADGSLGSIFRGGIFSTGIGRDTLTYGWDALRVGGDFYLVASVYGDPLLHIIKVPASRPDTFAVFDLRVGGESTIWPSFVRQAFPEDAIYVAGRMTDSGSVICDGFVAKVKSSGELDQSFSQTGWVSLQAAFGLDLVHGIVGMEVLADGTIIVAGTGNDGFVVALDAQGFAKRRFGTNGLVKPRGLYGTEPSSLAVSQSQRIITLGGTESDGNSIARPFVLIMDLDGRPTEAIRGGIVYVETEAKAQMRDHTILSDGRIVSLIHEGDFLRQAARLAVVGQTLP